MENILYKTKIVGERIFYNPNPQLSFEYLSHYSLSSNTFRGFHRLDKTKQGAGKSFRDVLTQQSNYIIQSILNAKNESDIELLSDELVKILKFELVKNINQHQLQSFNKIRKPVDIVIEHMVSMFEGFIEVRRRIVPFLFLPLDSQMFQSSFVFSEKEIIDLKLNRGFTFQDIWDKSHYLEIQNFLREKAEKLGMDRIFFDLAWNERYNSNGGNLFDTNPKRDTDKLKLLDGVTDIQANRIQEKTNQLTTKMKDYPTANEQRNDAKKNKLPEKLDELSKRLQKEPEFRNYQFRGLDSSRSNDYCIWLFGSFSDIIGIQIKHQQKTEKIVLNLRPINYETKLKDPFIKLMNKKGFVVENQKGDPYVGIQKIFTVSSYNRGILREDYNEIKFLLKSIVDWIDALS